MGLKNDSEAVFTFTLSLEIIYSNLLLVSEKANNFKAKDCVSFFFFALVCMMHINSRSFTVQVHNTLHDDTMGAGRSAVFKQTRMSHQRSP